MSKACHLTSSKLTVNPSATLTRATLGPVHITCNACGTSREYRGHSGRTQCRCGKKLYVPVATRRAAGIDDGVREHSARPRHAARHSHEGPPAGRRVLATRSVEPDDETYAESEGADLVALAIVVTAAIGFGWWCWHTFGRPWWELRKLERQAPTADRSEAGD